ncbi:MAG: chemotaxis protein CheA [Deltaproteobacteria bacterium]|nr:MAG: chemotaxis protein CheA [Deltaproteobacteria bacterium]
MAQDMSKYLDLFVHESTEHLDAIGRRLVELEREHSPTLVDEIFRHAHSVKGMAASMGFEPIAAIAHELEDVFEVLRRASLPLQHEEIDLALGATDAISKLVSAAAEGGSMGSVDLDWERLVRRLKACRVQIEARAERTTSDGAAAAAPAAGEGEARDAELPMLRVLVEIAGTSKVPGVRGFLVYKRLSTVGRIHRTSPSLGELKAGRLPDRRLEIVLATDEGRRAVEKQLSTVSELAAVQIEPYRPEPELSPPAPPKEPPSRSSGRTVRIRTDLLDGFMDTVGELILASDRLRGLVGRGEGEERTPVDDALDRLESIVRGLHAQVMATRMTPLASLTDKIPRIAREVARTLGKEVQVTVEGGEIELDRAILDELEAPLTHLIRNAVDHGIEAPDARDAAGKPRAGRISVSAQRDRDVVVLEVADDGRGFDRERLRRAAVEAGHLSHRQAEALSESELLMLACLPGLSTRTEVSQISGRGVGMDAVKAAVESLGGGLEIESLPGRGTTFRLRLPLTVAIQRLLLVGVGDDLFGLPITKVLQVVELEQRQASESGGQLLVPYQEGLVPAWSLAEALGLTASPGPRIPYVVGEGEGRALFALSVDRIAGHLEAVIKPLTRPLDAIAGLSGVTLLPDGRPLLVLDMAALAREVGA